MCSDLQGSPPPARGAPVACRVVGGPLRITPACAGSTAVRCGRCAPSWDHPRLRGEHPIHTQGLNLAHGSPPPARGAPAPRHPRTPRTRITPACAGSTTPPMERTRSSRDHPRLRGEHAVQAAILALRFGSPPPARGALDLAAGVVVGPRITPACAGSTLASTFGALGDSDHPRLRGEHDYITGRVNTDDGSPPPARGALTVTYSGGEIPGITPACAGSTPLSPPRRPSTKDHPRLRGEHALVPVTTARYCGSPPPARGARQCRSPR